MKTSASSNLIEKRKKVRRKNKIGIRKNKKGNTKSRNSPHVAVRIFQPKIHKLQSRFRRIFFPSLHCLVVSVQFTKLSGFQLSGRFVRKCHGRFLYEASKKSKSNYFFLEHDYNCYKQPTKINYKTNLPMNFKNDYIV